MSETSTAGLREDSWLGERLGKRAWTLEWGDDLDIGALAEHVRDNAPAFYQTRVPLDGVKAMRELGSVGFFLADVNVQLERDPRLGLPEVLSDARIDRSRPEDRDAVLAIAARSFEYDRFHLDPEIGDVVADAVKRDWVQSYFDGARGDHLLVAHADDRPIGFLCVLRAPRAWVIDLVAVEIGHRASGVAGALIAALIGTAGDEPVRVGTQASNTGSTRVYERLGFTTRSVGAVMHKHTEARS